MDYGIFALFYFKPKKFFFLYCNIKKVCYNKEKATRGGKNGNSA